jgi:exonuclease III
VENFVSQSDIVCLQETRLAPAERLALSALPGCVVSRNNLTKGQAGTLMIDTPRLCKLYKGADVALPPITKGHIQLRRYTPRDPSRPSFQLFNFYLRSGGDFAFNNRLLSSLTSVDSGVLTFVCGDLNFVDSPSDTTSPHPGLPTAAFRESWEAFRSHFGVIEVEHDAHTYFHVTADPLSPYSHTSRLDRFLVPVSLNAHPLFTPCVSIPHHPTNFSLTRRGPLASFSDHFPIHLSYDGEVTRSPGQPRWQLRDLPGGSPGRLET